VPALWLVLAAAAVFAIGVLVYYQTDFDAVAAVALGVPAVLVALALLYLLVRFVVWAARRR
jgi:hypothetical protein